MNENEIQETLERLNEIMREINDANRRGVEVSQDLYDEFEKLKSNLKDAEKSASGVDKSFTTLGKSAADLGRAMYRGEQGASVFTDTLEASAAAISAAIMLIPGIGIAAKAASVALVGVAKAANLAAEQGDTLYDSYVELAKSGAATAGGLDQVFENIQKFGMGIEQLDQFTTMIANNSEQLSKFAPTVGAAVEELGQISVGITSTRLRREFMMLGYTVPEINEAMVDYIALQSQVGMTQQRSTRQLTNSSADYLKTVDALTRATGIQRDQIQDNIRAARQEQQFRARMDRLREREPERAMQIETAFGVLAERAPEAAQALRGMTSGVVATEEAARLQAATGGRALQMVTSMMEGTLDPIQFMQSFAEVAGDASQNFGRIAEVGAFDRAFGPFFEFANLGVDAQKDLVASYNEAIANQEETGQQQASLLDRQVGMRIDQMEARDALQAMVQDGVAPATAAMEGLAGITRSVIDLLDTIPGIGREEGEQATGASFLQGSTAGVEAIPEGPSLGFGPGRVNVATPESRTYSSTVDQVVGSLISQLQGDTDVTPKDLFSGPNDPEGNTARRIVRGLGIDLDQNLSGSGEDTKLISALAQRYLGLIKHDEAPAGRQYKEEVAAAIAREFGINQEDVDSFRRGGISRGPESGYLSLMHGTEAVVPLPNGDSIPVSINGIDSLTRAFADGIEEMSREMKPDTNNNESSEYSRILNQNLREQLQSIRDQTKRLDSLIQVSQSNNNIMSRILQNSYA